MTNPTRDTHDSPHHGMGAYRQLWLLYPAHVAMMYILMFAMIDTAGHFWNNLNMMWMAVLMTSPMTALMVVAMPSMYPDRAKSLLVLTLCLALGVGSWLAIREQWGIADRQFLRSMIPHHSGAILMCQEADLSDPDIRTLCEEIIANQRAEILEMERLLRGG